MFSENTLRKLEVEANTYAVMKIRERMIACLDAQRTEMQKTAVPEELGGYLLREFTPKQLDAVERFIRSFTP